jgi:hypothetical protein
VKTRLVVGLPALFEDPMRRFVEGVDRSQTNLFLESLDN